MGHNDAIRGRRPCQDLRIAGAAQTGIGRRGEIDGGLQLPNSPDNVEIEIGVRLKANAQRRDSPVLTLARWIFSQSGGLACSSGIPLDSNSSSVSSRSLST